MTHTHSLFDRSQKVSPGGVQSPVRAFKSVGGEPLFFKSAHGAWLTSVEGTSYLDFCQGFGPNILGHRDPEVSQVVHEMVDTVWAPGTCDPYSLALSEWITEHVPWVDQVRFVCSGTEAVMTALRIARAATQREKVLKFEGCYHGHVDSMLVQSGSGLAEEGAASSSAGVSDKVASDTLLAPLNDFVAVENIFKARGQEIAALIIEPLPANFGLLEQTTEFLKAICDLARKYGALVIFDEVISGFRVALGGMAEITGIQPDLVTYGKVIGGGFPVGACAGRTQYMSLLAPSGPVYQAGTMAGHPLSMAAGLATLKKLKQLNAYPELEKCTENFAETINNVCNEKKWPFQVNSKASLFWLHYNPKKETLRSTHQFPPQIEEVYKKIFHYGLEQNLYLPPSAYEVGFVSLAHTPSLLQEAQNKILKSLEKTAFYSHLL